MPKNNRAVRIAKHLPQISDASKPLDFRLTAAEKLSGIRGGVGDPTRRVVRTILDGIQDEADSKFEKHELPEEEYRALCDRLNSIHERLTEGTLTRSIRNQRRKAQRELYESTIETVRTNRPEPPFPVPAEFADRFKWRFRVTPAGEVEWQLNQK